MTRQFGATGNDRDPVPGAAGGLSHQDEMADFLETYASTSSCPSGPGSGCAGWPAKTAGTW